MRHYIGLVHKEDDSDFGVSFPDFPGVITAGVSMDDACKLAQQALAFHVDALVDDGGTIPEPSSIEKVMADKDHRSGVPILIPLTAE
ncbi:hypothetical protein AU467_06785 [Mesorhizobium loti]|uniref:HicB-like antitoxin of toxin-antitoxin system domain-containing protein n=1 Tax=Rhizobium loti TaxID=381 RepID=A0A101KNM7_RHILI|nr:hypothetical protein AU467_06785 [Mesorhizobium loti]